MRLIDADKLMDFYLMRPTEEFSYERQYTAEDVALKIKDAPTIDPVMHGHWMPIRRFDNCEYHDDNYDTFECSVCKHHEEFEEEYTISEFTSKYRAHYCMNCGSRMDEEVSG